MIPFTQQSSTHKKTPVLNNPKHPHKEPLVLNNPIDSHKEPHVLNITKYPHKVPLVLNSPKDPHKESLLHKRDPHKEHLILNSPKDPCKEPLVLNCPKRSKHGFPCTQLPKRSTQGSCLLNSLFHTRKLLYSTIQKILIKNFIYSTVH